MLILKRPLHCISAFPVQNHSIRVTKCSARSNGLNIQQHGVMIIRTTRSSPPPSSPAGATHRQGGEDQTDGVHPVHQLVVGHLGGAETDMTLSTPAGQ